MQSRDERPIGGWPRSEPNGFGLGVADDIHIPIAGRGDQLEYIAELASSLAEYADRIGSGTLAGLLILAHHEALKELSRS